MKKAIHPCKPDCPKRSGDCHAICEEYKVYEALKQAEYEQNARNSGAQQFSPGRNSIIRDAWRSKRAGHRH